MILVSGIMPTRGRRSFAAQALDCFLAQTYPQKELIILDDADDPSFPYGCLALGVRYAVQDKRCSIAEKRNQCCELADGDILCHFDSDDYSAPERMADQVSRLQESGKAMTGYCTMPFFDEASKEAFVYENDASYALGTSLCYTREWQQAHPFADRWNGEKKCEDNIAIQQANDERQLISVPCPSGMMVARIHRDNAVPKSPQYYKSIPVDTLPVAFFQ